MTFTIRIDDLPVEGVRRDLEVPAEKAQQLLTESKGEQLAFKSALEGRLEIQPSGTRVVVKGTLDTVLRAQCSRCLESFDFSVQGEDVFVVFTPETSGERPDELEAESLNQEFYSGKEIDLWPVIVEHLILALPIKSLCREDCRGICPTCGANLNSETCGCAPKNGHPGLAGLKALRDKFPVS